MEECLHSMERECDLVGESERVKNVKSPEKCNDEAWAAEIGGQGGPWLLLNLRPLHRIVIFATENHLCLVKWPPLLSVVSSASAMKYVTHGD